MDNIELFELAYENHHKTRNYKDAVDLYKRIIEEYPTSKEARFSRFQLEDMAKYLSDFEVNSLTNSLNDEVCSILTSKSDIDYSKIKTPATTQNSSNPIQIALKILGFSIIALGIIGSMSSSSTMPYSFAKLTVILTAMLSSVAIGIFFIAMGEIIRLLEKISRK